MNLLEVLIIAALTIILILVLTDIQERFLASHSNYSDNLNERLFKFAEQYPRDLVRFEGVWTSQDAGIRKQVELRYNDAGYMIVSIDNSKPRFAKIRHLDSNKRVQLRIDGPLQEPKIGTYDLEVITQIPTAGEPIQMIKWKKQGDPFWLYLSKI